MGEITDAELKDRRILGEEGFISIFAAVDSSTGQVVAGPHLQARGLAEDDERLAEIVPQITEALTEAAGSGNVDTHQLQQVIRRVVGRWAAKRLRRRPMLVPVVVEA